MAICMRMLSLAVALLLGCGEQNFFRDEDPSQDHPDEGLISPGPNPGDFTDSTLTNLPQIVTALNLKPLHRAHAYGQGLTIAILDNGFAGLSASLGQRLPPDLKVEHAPRNRPSADSHGTKMAELVYAVATGSVNYSPDREGPKLLLYNTNGFSNLVHAIDDIIKRKVDIVLYAQIWEFGGNGDGKGFINAQVNRATSAGILWINAAGNYGKSTFSENIHLGKYGYVSLPYESKYIRLRAEQDTYTKISLGWNDFRDSIDYRTDLDLDLELFDANGRKLNESMLVQNGNAKATRPGETSAFAREVIYTNLPKGEYHIAVKSHSKHFPRDARLWVAANGPFLHMVDRGTDNSIFMPADNPNVISVGASDVDFSSSRDLSFGPPKPEMVSVSHVHFDDGESFAGTSAASAISAGALAAIASSHHPRRKLTRQLVLDLLSKQKISSQSLTLGPERPVVPILRLP